MRRQRLLGCAWALFASVVAAGSPTAWALAHGPQWTIGRAVIVSEHRDVSMRPALYLKLSLRNVGTPGRMPVRIFGRWAVSRPPPARRDGTGPRPRGYGGVTGWSGPGQHASTGTAGRWSVPGGTPAPGQAAGQSRWDSGRSTRPAQGGLPRGMRLLGSYNRDVSLNQTAILEVSLAQLGAPRSRTVRLEVVVMTASVVTDHQFISLAPD